MNNWQLTPAQQYILEQSPAGSLFLEGPAGSGKTTVCIQRMRQMIAASVAPASILLLTPQRSLAEPYLDELSAPDLDFPIGVENLTFNGLAQRMVDLFWPAISAEAGFSHPEQPPVFLTMETAQYYMAALARPYLEQGYFEAVVMDRNRLYSQVLDNLNKSALVGFPLSELGERLSAAWIGEPGQRTIYTQAQELALAFRHFCLENNLLDFSLQFEVFHQRLWNLPLCRDYLRGRYRHLLFDNIEEDAPLTHDLIEEWLPDFETAMLIYDTQAGYRIFLGADPQSAARFRELCTAHFQLDGNRIHTPAMGELRRDFSNALSQPEEAEENQNQPAGGARGEPALVLSADRPLRFHTEMLDWAAGQIVDLVRQKGIEPCEVAVLSPYLPDAMRFGLVNRLEENGIPVHSYRPSRGLRDEAAVRCLLTLAQIAHPDWGLPPTRAEVAACLVQSIAGLDLVRAQLMAEVLYSPRQKTPILGSFSVVRPEMRERITYRFGEEYETLRAWLAQAQGQPPEALDHFLSRLFGEVLSQPGFGFHQAFDRGAAAARLIESARKFRLITGQTMEKMGWSVGREFTQVVLDGVIASQYQPQSWADEENAVLLAPAFSFLMRNRPVEVQFWLDVGSMGWWERLNQPLTQPYVLSRAWPSGQAWTDADEYRANQDMLARVITGLLRRCRRQIYLGISDLSVQGYEQQGPLLQVIQNILRSRASRPGHPGEEHV